jgi:hypothetical protein
MKSDVSLQVALGKPHIYGYGKNRPQGMRDIEECPSAAADGKWKNG